MISQFKLFISHYFLWPYLTNLMFSTYSYEKEILQDIIVVLFVLWYTIENYISFVTKYFK